MRNTLLSQLPSTRTPLRVSRADLKLAWGFVICRARKSFSNFKYVLVKLAEIYSSSANFLPLPDPHMQVRLVLLLFYNTSYSRNIINVKKSPRLYRKQIFHYVAYFEKSSRRRIQAEDWIILQFEFGYNSMYEFPFVLLEFLPSKDEMYKIQTPLTDALSHSSLFLQYNKTYEHETSHSVFYALDVQ